MQEDLAGGGGQEIRSAHDFGDAHENVIDHHREFIGGYVIPIPDEEIPEVASGGLLIEAEVSIHKRDRLAIRNTEAPINARGCLEFFRLRGIGAPFHRKQRLLGVRCQGGHFLS